LWYYFEWQPESSNNRIQNIGWSCLCGVRGINRDSSSLCVE
jgi:hypothetical protein